MIRLAFTFVDSRLWTGGYNYLLNLFGVLNRYRPGEIKPILFSGTDVSDAQAAPFLDIEDVEVVRSAAFDGARNLRSLVAALSIGADPAIRRTLHAHRIDVVFEVARFFGARIGIPAIAWMADFQHRSLPEAFSALGYWKRELGFRAQVAAGRDVMLSSADARSACERFYPASVGRTHVVRFAVAPPEPAGLEEARKQADDYGLPDRFFFMPNQFWQHKNHLLVAEALAILRGRNAGAVIAASGKQADPRNPGHFDKLAATIKRLGVVDDFRLLGMIPYRHLTLLMQASVALVNPSLFEGWSTTVEEARSLGVPMILSDLPVHREQVGDGASYFACDDAAGLADALQAFVPLEPRMRERAAAAARLSAESRVARFAADFVALAKLCASRGCR